LTLETCKIYLYDNKYVNCIQYTRWQT